VKSLVLLCHDPLIPPRQQIRFCESLVTELSCEASNKDIALKALRALWVRYDSGGISCGRSLRASLLEKIIGCIDRDEDLPGTHTSLSILLGMYHDPVFVNASRWYDYKIEHFSEIELFHRIWLATAAFSLEIDEVADMVDWPIERLRALLTN
jgi:hypothetical protein